MSIELITGRAGKPHVDSQDVRAYQAYTAGSARYVLHGGVCSVESANQVSIAPGEILVDGAHVRVTGDGETITLANGQTGYKRVDIVALHYTVAGSGESIVESMEFAAVQGSPSDTDPEDPIMPQSGSILEGVTETYIPYARVVIDGLSPQEPEMIVEQYCLPVTMGGTGSTDGDGAIDALGITADKVGAVPYEKIGKQLWQGTAAVGATINVPGASEYDVFVVYNSASKPLLAARNTFGATKTLIFGSYNSTDSDWMWVEAVTLEQTSETAIKVSAYRVFDCDAGTFSDGEIRGIRGLF